MKRIICLSAACAALILGGCSYEEREAAVSVTSVTAEAMPSSEPAVKSDSKSSVITTLAGDYETVAQTVTSAETVPSAETEAVLDNIADSAADDAGLTYSDAFYETAEGDVVIISVGDNFYSCSVKYGNIVKLEDESTSNTLYFQAVSPGKDTVVISENSPDGLIFREYAVIISEELSAELYPVSENVPVPYDMDDIDSSFYY